MRRTLDGAKELPKQKGLAPARCRVQAFDETHPNSARGSIHLGWPLAARRQSRPNWLEG